MWARKIGLVLILLGSLILPACTPLTSLQSKSSQSEQAAAEDALRAYFAALSAGDMAGAASLFSGEWEILQDNNPNVDPADREKLFSQGCEINGFVCNLTLASISAVKKDADGSFVFTVKFTNPDGTEFVLGPCCGATETDQPSIHEFNYHVKKIDGRYQILDLPVYIP